MKKGIALAILFFAVFTTGCATATKEKINNIAQAPSVSPVIAQAQVQVLKRKVAIVRFSDETKRGASFLINADGSKVGKQASDILAARLTESGKFIMFERSDLDKVISEQQYGNVASQKIGADFLIVGSVSEFGRSNESEVGVFSRNKIQTARATVNVRLIDTATGQIVFSQEGKGEARSEANTVFGVGEHAGYDSNLDDQAISAAISKMTSSLMENLLEKPWQAFLIKDETNQLFLTSGPSQGVRTGDVFKVLKRGNSIKNPQTGMMVELPGVQVATVKILGAVGQGDNELSVCELESGSIQGQQLDKLVVVAR
jgi:curli biogenesis system outer membrane secretion channel CsgG